MFQATAMHGAKNSLQTDYTLRILGLDICADTIVGNEMIRGISGGQKKCVTTGSPPPALWSARKMRRRTMVNVERAQGYLDGGVGGFRKGMGAFKDN